MAETNIPDTPAKRIKRLRIEKQLTQDELAKLCGVSRVTIMHYELGHASPNRSIRKLAVALGTTVDYILYGDTTPSKTPVVTYQPTTGPESTSDRSWELMEYIFRDEDKRILSLLKKGRLNVDGKITNADDGAIYNLDDDSCRLVRLAIKNALKEMIAGKREVAKIQNTEGEPVDEKSSTEPTNAGGGTGAAAPDALPTA